MPGVAIDAPTTIAWEHANGIRGVWDITLAPDMYLRSDYYTNDERWEVTGRRGLRAREPLHRARHPAAEPRGVRRRRDARRTTTLDDDWGSSFDKQTRATFYRYLVHGGEEPLWNAEHARGAHAQPCGLRVGGAEHAGQAAGLS